MGVDLFQQQILKHSQHPQHYGKLKEFTHHIEGFNRICGDHINLYLVINNGSIKDISFESDSCAIVTASASIMTEIVNNKKLNSIMDRLKEIESFLQNKTNKIGSDLKIMHVVHDFPSRRQCASLPWHSLNEIIKELK